MNNLESFPRLVSLVLDNNSIDDTGIRLPSLPALSTFCINNNAVTDIEALLNELAAKAPKLRYLSLLKNPCCPTPIFNAEKDDDDYQRYRYFVLHKLPKLQFLDSNQVTEEELAEARRVGEFMRVARPESLKTPPRPKPDDALEVRPLSDELRPEGAGPARFGISKYVYYGRQSEGNRFIVDQDL
eukprot:c9553_g1_i2.p1 GENE.c9553_g1_i2~~c9553_g1_i2.p1  ORF type:complete len:185 (-),score=41.02 c9553_g1_i2:27-581(-)